MSEFPIGPGQIYGWGYHLLERFDLPDERRTFLLLKDDGSERMRWVIATAIPVVYGVAGFRSALEHITPFVWFLLEKDARAYWRESITGEKAHAKQREEARQKAFAEGLAEGYRRAISAIETSRDTQGTEL